LCRLGLVGGPEGKVVGVAHLPRRIHSSTRAVDDSRTDSWRTPVESRNNVEARRKGEKSHRLSRRSVEQKLSSTGNHQLWLRPRQAAQPLPPNPVDILISQDNPIPPFHRKHPPSWHIACTVLSRPPRHLPQELLICSISLLLRNICLCLSRPFTVRLWSDADLSVTTKTLPWACSQASLVMPINKPIDQLHDALTPHQASSILRSCNPYPLRIDPTSP
jgi:hypothetical protein